MRNIALHTFVRCIMQRGCLDLQCDRRTQQKTTHCWNCVNLYATPATIL